MDTTSDPRLALIALAIAIGDTEPGRRLCERLLRVAAEIDPMAAPAMAAAMFDPGVSSALAGIADGLSMIAGHAEYLANQAERLTAAAPSRS